MTAREILKQFVLAKRRYIKFHCPEAPPYATEQDLAEIDTWPEAEADRVLGAIARFVFLKGESGLSHNTCPWCVKTVIRCNECDYMLRHGLCSVSFHDNDYHWIALEMSLRNVDLSNEWYARLLKRIVPEDQLKTYLRKH